MRSIVFLSAGVLVASALLADLGWAQGTGPQPPASAETKPIGKVQNLTGSVTIEHTRAAVLVQVNAPAGGGPTKIDDAIYLGDVVETGAGAAIGIIFGDGTSFNVSENARMEINEFVYDPKGASNSTLFNLTKGTFTFLAGKTAKTGNMRVETPVGTMGIRGTAPHVEILPDGTVKFTTLVEENKNTVTDSKPHPVSRERRAQNRPAQPALPKAGRNRLLDICRGC